MNYSKTFVSFFFSKTSFQRNTRRVSFPKPAQPNKRRQIKPKNKCIHFFSPPHDLMAMAHVSMYGCRCGIFLPPSSPSTTHSISTWARLSGRLTGWDECESVGEGGEEGERRGGELGPFPQAWQQRPPPHRDPGPPVGGWHTHAQTLTTTCNMDTNTGRIRWDGPVPRKRRWKCSLFFCFWKSLDSD